MKKLSLEEKLDRDLKFVAEFGEVFITPDIFNSGVKEYHDNDEVLCAKKLSDDGYIEYDEPNGSMRIKASGKLFLANGGYQKIKKDSKREKKKNTTLFIITIVSVLIALGSFILSVVERNDKTRVIDERFRKIEHKVDSLTSFAH